MWILRELMIPYAYPVMLEYLNIAHTVSKITSIVCKKTESTYFCTNNGQNGNYSENEHSWKNVSFNVSRKGANDFLCIPSDARIFKYSTHCVQKISKYLFLH